MIKLVADHRWFIGIFVILILGSLSLSWFKGDYLIAGGDYFFDLKPNLSLQSAIYSWSPHGLGAFPNARPTILFSIILALFQAIGLAPTLVEKIIFYFLFTGSGLSMYILTSVVTKKDNITPLFSALFYMLSFWSLVHIWTVPYTFSLSFGFAYSFLPLILGLFIKGLNERNVRFILASAFATLLSSPSFTNPVIFVIVLGLPVLYTVYHVIAERGGPASMKMFALFTSASLSLNVFWILPLLPLVGSFLSSPYRMYASDLAVFRSQSLPILETIRMTGYWTLHTEVFGDPIIPWSLSFSSSLFVVLSFLMPVLSFVAILLRHKDKHVVFFTLVAVITIFLMKGSAPPFGDLTEKVFMATGLISVFRVPVHKFGIYLTLCFSFLTAFVLRSAIPSIKKNQQGNMLHKVRHWLRNILRISPVAIIIFALVGAYVWPFWTGDVIRSKGDIIPSARVKVPDYYHYADEWLSSQSEDFNVLSLPLQSSSTQAAYLWSNGSEGYFGAEPGLVISTKPLIFTVHDGNGIIGSVIELLSRGTTYRTGKVLQLFNVKYILVHDDLQLDLAKAYTMPDPKRISVILNSTRELELEKTFGNLRFYRNSEWKPRSHIYASSNVLFTYGITEILPVVSSDRFVLSDSVLFLQTQLTPEQLAIVEKYPSVFFVNRQILNITVYDGSREPFNWSLLKEKDCVVRYYSGWKSVIRMDGTQTEDTLSFPSMDESPYIFPLYSPTGWAALNASLVYLRTGNESMRIDAIYVDGKEVEVRGVWWETGYLGMDTKPIAYPILIPPAQRAIIQLPIENRQPAIVTLAWTQIDETVNQNKPSNSVVTITYEKDNPTNYIVHVNASEPFFLVFSESYHKDWVAYVDGQQIPDEHHFIANGYANGWYINKTGAFTITLEFWPQNLFYAGSAISITTLILCALYVSKDKIKTIYQKHIKRARRNVANAKRPSEERCDGYC